MNGGSPGSPIRSSSSGAIDHGPYNRSMGMSLIVENDALRSGARFSAGSSRSRSQSRRRSVMRPTLAPALDQAPEKASIADWIFGSGRSLVMTTLTTSDVADGQTTTVWTRSPVIVFRR